MLWFCALHEGIYSQGLQLVEQNSNNNTSKRKAVRYPISGALGSGENSEQVTKSWWALKRLVLGNHLMLGIFNWANVQFPYGKTWLADGMNTRPLFDVT